jgi:hypothetical protein
MYYINLPSHNLKVVGSNPAPATKNITAKIAASGRLFCCLFAHFYFGVIGKKDVAGAGDFPFDRFYWPCEALTISMAAGLPAKSMMSPSIAPIKARASGAEKAM